MSGPWSAEQREWLQALGHPALVLAPGGDNDAGAVVSAGGTPEAAPPAMNAGADIDGSRVRGPLHAALLKATGRAGPEAEQVLRELGVDRCVHMDAPAKRALWPRLRQLRGHRPT